MELELLRHINFILTPFSLGLSIALLFYAIRALRRNNDKENKIVGISLFSVGVIFLIESLALFVVYLIIFGAENRPLINLIMNIANLFINTLTIITSFVLIQIYRNRI